MDGGACEAIHDDKIENFHMEEAMRLSMHHDITAVDVEVTTVSAAPQIETLPAAAAAAAFAPVSQVSQTSDLRSCRRRS